jgi:hypothetical protein
MSGITLDELVDIQITDGTNTLSINGDGSIDVAFAAGAQIEITDGTDTLEVNADGSINAVVTATDLDIRDLVNTQDSIAIGDATNLVGLEQSDDAFSGGYGFSMYGVRQDAAGSPVSADGDAHPLVFNDDGELKVAADLTSDVADDATDGGNPIKIGGRGVDGLLTALSASGDRYDLLGDLYRRTWVNNSANVGMNVDTETVGTTAVELASTPLAGRKFITVQNEGNQDIFIGHSNAVTTGNGIKVSKKSSATFELGEDIDVWAISGSAGQDVRVLQAG